MQQCPESVVCFVRLGRTKQTTLSGQNTLARGLINMCLPAALVEPKRQVAHRKLKSLIFFIVLRSCFQFVVTYRSENPSLRTIS